MKIKKILPIAGLFVLTIAFFAEAIFLGKTFFLGDTSLFFYPMKHFIAEVVKSGHLPLWNPYIHSGMPQIANLESGFFYPPSIIFYLLPFDLAYRYFVISHYFLAGLFMYLLLRHWSLSRYSAFFSGIVFMFSGYLVSMSNGINILSSAVWAPLIILFLDKAIRRRSPPFFLLTGIFISIQFLSGDPVNTYFTIIICVLYLLVHIVGLIKGTKKSQVTSHKSQVESKKVSQTEIFCLLRGRQDTEEGGEEEEGTKAQRHRGTEEGEAIKQQKLARRENFRQGLTLLFFFLLAGVTALLLSACQLLPSIEFTRLSTRCLGLTYAHASHWSLEPCRLLTFFAPYLFGNTATSPFAYTLLFKLHAPFFPSIYLGILPLCLSLISILFVRKKQVWFFSSILVLSLFLALGKHTSIHYLFWRYIPLYNFFRFPVKAIYLVTISVSVLAGFGMERVIKGLTQDINKPFRNKAAGWRSSFSGRAVISKGPNLFSKILLNVSLSLLFFFAALYVFRTQTVFLLQPLFPSGHLLANAFVWNSIITNSFKATAVFSIVSILLFLGIAQRIKIRVFRMLMLIILLGDLAAVNLCMMALTEVSFYNKKPVSVKFLEMDKTIYRLYRSPLDLDRRPPDLTMSRKEFYGWSKEMLFPNRGIIYNLFYADVNEAAHLLKSDILQSAIEAQSPSERTRLLGLLNVKYVFSKDSIRHPALKMANQVKDDVKIYENLQFLPRAFLTSKFVEVDTPRQALGCLLDPRIDLGKVAILVKGITEPQRNFGSFQQTHFLATPYDARFTGLNCEEQVTEIQVETKKVFTPVGFNKYTPGEIVINADSQRGGLLVFTDVYYPGWKVWVDGVRKELLNVDYIFRGVFLEKGTHKVRFVYDPLSIKLGIGISLIAAAALAVCLLSRYNKNKEKTCLKSERR